MTETADALLKTLRATTGRPELAFAAEPTPLTGGFYAEMLRFSLIDPPMDLGGELVARIIPNEELGRWEATVQSELTRQHFASPAVRLTAPATGPLGRFLIVMDLVPGTPPLAGLTLGGLVRQIPTLVRTLPDQLARITAELHRLDPGPLVTALDALDSPVPTTLSGFISERIENATTLGRDDLVQAGRRLLQTEPHTTTRVICHGDLHPLNLLVTEQGGVLIDWTVARVAHPAFDLAFTQLMLSNPPMPMPAAAKAALGPLARSIAGRFLRRYRSMAAPVADLNDEVLGWHRQVHALRALVELASWDAAGHRPPHHPWVVLEPVLRQSLGLQPASS
jgi:aminoglycoside phosphotransferase (APT) family kinase protein